MQWLATQRVTRVTSAWTIPRLTLPFVVAGVLLLVSMAAHAFDWRVEVTPAGELFPALELSQIPADDAADAGNGLLRVHLAGAAPASRARVTVATPGLVAPTVLDVTLAGEQVLRPRLDWDIDALRALAAARTQDLEVTIERDGQPTLVRRVPVRVHPLDEALYFVRDGDARIDLGFAFAAWVDPHAAVVDELIALAGIAEGRERVDGVAAARAIWVALERRGLRYADEGAGISQGPVIYSQRVRLLADTWNERVANCLDGSVLIASALERLGIRSMLVLVPGHAFIGFESGGDSRHVEFLETTLLGRGARVGEPASAVESRARDGFAAALAAGQASYRRAASRLDGRHRPNYAIIDISTARSYGIMPLAVGRSSDDGADSVPPTASPSASE